LHSVRIKCIKHGSNDIFNVTKDLNFK